MTVSFPVVGSLRRIRLGLARAAGEQTQLVEFRPNATMLRACRGFLCRMVPVQVIDRSPEDALEMESKVTSCTSRTKLSTA